MNRFIAVGAPIVLLSLGFGAARLVADDEKPASPPPAPVADAKTDAKTERVRKLLRDQGAGEIAKMTMDKMMDQFQNMPGLPPGFIEKFKEKASAEQVMDLAIPSYVKYLDDDTIDAIIAFNETPAGRKLGAVLPKIMMETMDAGSQWGQKMAMEILKDLEKQPPK